MWWLLRIYLEIIRKSHAARRTFGRLNSRRGFGTVWLGHRWRVEAAVAPGVGHLQARFGAVR
jgi:hypothetical protein